MPRLVFDFPGTTRVYRDPVAVHTATSIDDVVPALRAAEAAVRAGRHVAGYLAYEAAPAFEPRMAVRSGNRMPLLWLGEFESYTEDAGRGGPGRGSHARAVAEAEPGRDAGGAGDGGGRDPTREWDWALDASAAEHAAAVAAVRAAIAAGETYQVNLTARFRARVGPGGPDSHPAEALFHQLRRAQGPGYHAFLDLGRFAIASATPELFFRTRAAAAGGGRVIETRPMKGTRPRGRWPAEDRTLRAALASSPKDRAENLMIIDLLRNDVGRVAVPGTVAVPRMMDVERYRTVWQLTSTITGRLRDDLGLVDLFRALFPCGSVTGAPKIRTMEVIAGLETSAREVYCGAIGFVEPADADAGWAATFSVPIRTAWIDREAGVAEYGAGGGVVWDSTPDAEYRELTAKAVVLRERWPDFRLLETLRLQDGRLVRLDRHLARLRGSADYFGFPFPDDDIRAALHCLTRDHPAGSHRVRLVLAEDGSVQAEAAPLEEVGAAPLEQAAAVPREQAGAVPLEPAGTAPLEQPAPPLPRVVLADAPVDSGDRFLFHKTTHRETYDRRAAAAPPGTFDVLLHNERGEVTEFTRGNIVVELDGRRVTPPLEAGLLPGCLRGELLDDGAVVEQTVRPEDLSRATRIWFVNSLRGWIEVERPRGL